MDSFLLRGGEIKPRRRNLSPDDRGMEKKEQIVPFCFLNRRTVRVDI